MMHQTQEMNVQIQEEQERTRRVDAILRRQKERSLKRKECFPPDFLHGAVALGEIYEVCGPTWAERAIFVAGSGDVVSVAYFDDYFLVVEQWIEGESGDWSAWWNRRQEERDRIVVMITGECPPIKELEGVSISVERSRLQVLERGVLGVERDGIVDECSQSARLRQSQIDVLSLVTLTSELSER